MSKWNRAELDTQTNELTLTVTFDELDALWEALKQRIEFCDRAIADGYDSFKWDKRFMEDILRQITESGL